MTIVNTTTGEIIEPLTSSEEFTLEQYEEIIDAGLKTFVEVGHALATIRNGRLYRATHQTFETYCDDRWHLSRPRAYQLIEAAEVVDSLSTVVDTPLPKTERQARELAPLKGEPDVARKVWQDVQEQSAGKPTAAIVRAAVKRHLSAVPAAPPQDEAFWNAAAEKLTANGWVAKREAEKPYLSAIVRLERIARDVEALAIDPMDLASHLPESAAESLPQIEAAWLWLNTFVTAQKEY